METELNINPYIYYKTHIEEDLDINYLPEEEYENINSEILTINKIEVKLGRHEISEYYDTLWDHFINDPKIDFHKKINGNFFSNYFRKFC